MTLSWHIIRPKGALVAGAVNYCTLLQLKYSMAKCWMKILTFYFVIYLFLIIIIIIIITINLCIVFLLMYCIIDKIKWILFKFKILPRYVIFIYPQYYYISTHVFIDKCKNILPPAFYTPLFSLCTVSIHCVALFWCKNVYCQYL